MPWQPWCLSLWNPRIYCVPSVTVWLPHHKWTHIDQYREGLARPCDRIQDPDLYEPRSIHQCCLKWYDAVSLSHSWRRCLLYPLACNMPQLVRTPLFGLFLCSQRCSSPAFPFFGLDVTDILGSFEGGDGGTVIEVSPIARELFSL